MTFRALQNIGLGLMLLLLLLVGVLPSLAIHKLARHEKRIAESLQETNLVLSLDSEFRKILFQFRRLLENNDSDFSPILVALDKCLEICEAIGTAQGESPGRISDEDSKSLQTLLRSIRLFKFAVEIYRQEAANDPAADNTHQMEVNAIEAQTQAAQAFTEFMGRKLKRIETDHEAISVIFRKSQRKTITGLLVGILLAVCVALLLSKSLSRPISMLLLGAERIAKGDLDCKVETTAKGEFGRLAHAFERMRKEIKVQIEHQSELVLAARTSADSERTKSKELAHTNSRLEREIELRQRAEASLSQALANTRHILESLPFGVVLVGRDKKIRMLNPASLKMMGADSSDGCLNRTCHQFICPAQENACPIVDLGQEVDASEKILLGHQGESIPILKTVLPIVLDGEDVLLETFVDISVLKRTQAELKQAMEKAEAASRVKSEFLANMSHELRTPLNHIIGFTELVLDKNFGELNDVQEEYLNDVVDSSKHLLSLINEVLDLSKVEAGKMELELSDVNLASLLENAKVMIQKKAVKHAIQITTKFNGLPEVISADGRKLKQILYNLLSNAVKFTPDGGNIRLSAEIVDDLTGMPAPNEPQPSGQSIHTSSQRPSTPQPFIRVSVSDTGIGLEPENLELIFNPFEQVEGSTSRKFQGTGLGLALLKKMASLHGGTIWAESKGRNQGATFYLTVPL